MSIDSSDENEEANPNPNTDEISKVQGIDLHHIYRLKPLLCVSRLNRHFTCQNLAEVDFECHQLIGKASVYVNEQGIIYSAMLNQVPLATLNSKLCFCLIFRRTYNSIIISSICCKSSKKMSNKIILCGFDGAELALQ